jgi:mono/diheme cytochrome c family protein
MKCIPDREAGPKAADGAGRIERYVAFGAILTDEQIWAVLAYIKSKWPEKIQARQSTFNKGGSK